MHCARPVPRVCSSRSPQPTCTAGEARLSLLRRHRPLRSADIAPWPSDQYEELRGLAFAWPKSEPEKHTQAPSAPPCIANLDHHDNARRRRPVQQERLVGHQPPSTAINRRQAWETIRWWCLPLGKHQPIPGRITPETSHERETPPRLCFSREDARRWPPATTVAVSTEKDCRVALHRRDAAAHRPPPPPPPPPCLPATPVCLSWPRRKFCTNRRSVASRSCTFIR